MMCEKQIISTAEELDALPEGSVVIDRFKDVSQLRGGEWCGYEMVPLVSKFLKRYGPFQVLHTPRSSDV